MGRFGLSREQQWVLKTMVKESRRLVRCGTSWAPDGTRTIKNMGVETFVKYIPWVEVLALEKRGFIERSRLEMDQLIDPRQLTETGFAEGFLLLPKRDRVRIMKTLFKG